jgi:hypothetical protein
LLDGCDVTRLLRVFSARERADVAHVPAAGIASVDKILVEQLSVRIRAVSDALAYELLQCRVADHQDHRPPVEDRQIAVVSKTHRREPDERLSLRVLLRDGARYSAICVLLRNAGGRLHHVAHAGFALMKHGIAAFERRPDAQHEQAYPHDGKRQP